MKVTKLLLVEFKMSQRAEFDPPQKKASSRNEAAASWYLLSWRGKIQKDK
jgi:hypothetical protein